MRRDLERRKLRWRLAVIEMVVWYESCWTLAIAFRLMLGLVGLLWVTPAPGAALPLDEHHAALYVEGSRPTSRVVSAGGPTTGVRAQTVDAFFADVLRVQPAILMSCAGCAEPITATPEPAPLLLFGTALAGIGLIVRRQLRRSGVGTRS